MRVRGSQPQTLGLVVMYKQENMQNRSANWWLEIYREFRSDLPEQIMHVTQEEEKHRELLNLDLDEGFLQEELDEGRSPHENTGGQ